MTISLSEKSSEIQKKPVRRPRRIIPTKNTVKKETWKWIGCFSEWGMSMIVYFCLPMFPIAPKKPFPDRRFFLFLSDFRFGTLSPQEVS